MCRACRSSTRPEGNEQGSYFLSAYCAPGEMLTHIHPFNLHDKPVREGLLEGPCSFKANATQSREAE